MDLTEPSNLARLAAHCRQCEMLAPMLSDPQLAVAQHALLDIAKHQMHAVRYDKFLRNLTAFLFEEAYPHAA